MPPQIKPAPICRPPDSLATPPFAERFSESRTLARLRRSAGSDFSAIQLYVARSVRAGSVIGGVRAGALVAAAMAQWLGRRRRILVRHVQLDSIRARRARRHGAVGRMGRVRSIRALQGSAHGGV